MSTSRAASESNAADKEKESDSTYFAGLASYGSGLANYGYSLSRTFFSATSATEKKSLTPEINLESQNNLEKYIANLTMELLQAQGEYFSFYLKEHGETQPSGYDCVNTALANAGGGYFRTNQPYAKRARDALLEAKNKNEDTNKTQEALCVYRALQKLSIIHKEMVTPIPNHVGKVSKTIETIFRVFNLSVNPAKYESQLAIMGDALEKHFNPGVRPDKQT